MGNSKIGVWIGEDIEIVRTEKLEIIYRKFKSNGCLFFDSILYNLGTQGKDGWGRVLLNITNKELWYYLKERKENRIVNKYIFDRWNISTPTEEKIFNEENYQCQEDKLYINNKELRAYELLKGEDINISKERIISPKLSETTVEEALKQWIMGAGVRNGNQIRVTINTKKHLYIFQISDNFIYCRAARYATCEKGIVFVQNFRISARNGKITSGDMVANNRVALEPVDIDDSLFDPDKCIMQDKWWQGIYWSVREKTDNLIKLNGCNGDIYTWPRLWDKNEWFI